MYIYVLTHNKSQGIYVHLCTYTQQVSGYICTFMYLHTTSLRVYMYIYVLTHKSQGIYVHLCTYTLGTQSLTVLSRDADAIKCPDGENLTERTAS